MFKQCGLALTPSVTCQEKSMLQVAAPWAEPSKNIHKKDLNPPTAGLDQPQLSPISRTSANIQYRLTESTDIKACYFKPLSFRAAYSEALLWQLLTNTARKRVKPGFKT